MSNTVELKYDGRSYEMTPAQLRTTNIGLVFGLDPKTIWLKDVGGRCYFPDGEEFKYGDMEDHTYSLRVEGWPLGSTEKLPLTFVASPGQEQGSSNATPCRTKGLGSKSYSNCTVKVVRAKKEIGSGGKIEFCPFEATYLELKPSTANASYIKSQVQKIWGPEYVIVSNDGLEMVDTSATRGTKFWKVGSRKIFAISSKLHQPKKRKHSDSDDDSVTDRLDSIDFKLSKILDVTPHLSLPLGLSAQLYDTFKCNICKISPIVPPAIFARCCKRILGCMECTDKWYTGEDGIRDCPLCRSDRGYSDTSKILGMDDFLITIRDLLQATKESTSEMD